MHGANAHAACDEMRTHRKHDIESSRTRPLLLPNFGQGDLGYEIGVVKHILFIHGSYCEAGGGWRVTASDKCTGRVRAGSEKCAGGQRISSSHHFIVRTAITYWSPSDSFL